MDDAWAAHDELQEEYLRLVNEQERLEIELDQVRSMDPREFISDDEYDETESDDPLGRIGAYWLKRKNLGTYDYHQKIAIGEVRKRERILILTEQLNEVKAAIVELEKVREQKRETAEEYSRRYKECEANRDEKKPQNGGMTLRLFQSSTSQRSS